MTDSSTTDKNTTHSSTTTHGNTTDTSTIDRLLVANRGEIARRVFRTCREMGIETVAVFTPADAGSLHVGEADVAVALPDNGSYLDIDALLLAAAESGADGVHPGYGFLSESAPFARAVRDAGLTWVGPPAEAIEAMGSKIAAKKLLADAGVPVLAELDPTDVTEADLPVLIKASAGGGGRGMRVVRDLSALPALLESARAEAASAFGDPTVFCEPYLERGRHIEVQVMADQHGTVWTLGERECSLQRRHQKVLEETPSTFVDQALRDRLCDAATKAAAATGYVGAGTVEFLVDGDGRFFVLEMNTRLQVEHPVTECVTGLDLVRLQLEVAAGARLGEPPTASGHAIEVRLYAEDPANGWHPQSGMLHAFEIPTGSGIRVDSGVTSGSTVGVHYDPMLAKVISWALTRQEAARRLAATLAQAKIHGLVTNRELVVRALRHPAFRSGQTTTSFLEHDHLPELTAPLADEQAVRLSAVAAAFAQATAGRPAAAGQPRTPVGWRNLASAPLHKAYLVRGQQVDVSYRASRTGLVTDDGEIACAHAQPSRITLAVGALRHTFDVAVYGELVEVDSALGPVTLHRVPRHPQAIPQEEPGSLLAPMPGVITRIGAVAGDTVHSGQPVFWLEAMKMEHQLLAPTAGIVSAVNAVLGQQVELGHLLAVIEEQQ